MMMGTSPKSEKAGTELRRNSFRTGSFNRKSSVTTLLKRYPSDTELSNELELTLGHANDSREIAQTDSPLNGDGLIGYYWFPRFEF